MIYRELFDELCKLTFEQLDQQVQVLLTYPDQDRPAPLHPVLGIGTVAEADRPTRSARDNQHHSDSIILFADWNLFAEDGTIVEDLETGERF